MDKKRENTFRHEKAIENIKRIAAEFLEMESNKTTLITVTNASISKDLKKATLYITVLPEEREMEALEFTRRRLSDFRDYVKTKMKFRNLPFFTMEIDKEGKILQKIDEITKKK